MRRQLKRGGEEFMCSLFELNVQPFALNSKGIFLYELNVQNLQKKSYLVKSQTVATKKRTDEVYI